MKMSLLNRKRRKYLDGALYTSIFQDSACVINVSRGEVVNLNMITKNNIITTMTIFVEENKDNLHLRNCKRLGRVLSQFRGNTR